MSDDSPQRKRFNQVFWVVMGSLWIALAIFGLIFDPEKRVIIFSQIVAGGLCFAVYIVHKLKKMRE